MGGGYYDRDVYSGSSSGGWDYSSDAPADKGFSKAREADEAVLDTKRKLTCDKENPIMVVLDVTGSMGIAAKVIYDKMPMFFGQIKIQNYLPDPSISFAAVGDVPDGDSCPIQICDFAEGDALDEWLGKIYLEGGGGGGHHESYEMLAYYYDKMVELTHPKKNPYLFFIGDEGFYSKISASDIKTWFGIKCESENSVDVFKRLKDKYNVFLIHKTYHYASNDKTILRQWTDALGQENVLVLEDPKAVVDVMLGAIALVAESRDLDSYIADLKGLGADPDRTQDAKRISDVAKSLEKLNSHVTTTALVKADVSTKSIAAVPKRKTTTPKKHKV